MSVLHEIRVKPLHILVDEVVEFSRPFDSCRNPTNDSEVEELFRFLLSCRRQSSSLKARKQPVADLPGVSYILKEIGVFSDALRIECLGIASDRNDQLVLCYVEELALCR